MGKAGMRISIAWAAVSCTMAAVLLMKRVQSRSRRNRVESIVRDFEDGCSTSSHQLRQLVDAMSVEMHAGLASEGGSKLRMLLTFVENLPTGDEKGLYYALHLGRSSFRLLRVQLGGKEGKVVNEEFEEVSIPESLMVGGSEEFFDYIVSGLESFVKREGEGFKLHPGRKRELGFTVSFPMRKISVCSGTLTKWTKAFAIEEMVRNDIGECLQKAMARKGLDMRVSALVNDAVGTLAGGRYYDGDVMAAVILGTGTNACYVERADSITKGQGLLAKSGGMVINMEWGDFWSSHLPRTPYDDALDMESSNPGLQVFEKLISALYLGEIVRRVILRIAQESGVFGDAAPSSLSIPFTLRLESKMNLTSHVSAMHQDESADLREVGRIMQDALGVPEIPLRVKKVIVKVCDLVIERAARLAAAGIVGILKKIGRDGTAGLGGGRITSDTTNRIKRTVIAMDGSLYELYPKFRNHLQVAVAELLGEEAAPNIIIQLSKYISGVGGALLAASNSIYSDE